MISAASSPSSPRISSVCWPRVGGGRRSRGGGRAMVRGKPRARKGPTAGWSIVSTIPGLHLDDVGAHVPEQHGAEGAGEAPGEGGPAQPVGGARGGGGG